MMKTFRALVASVVTFALVSTAWAVPSAIQAPGLTSQQLASRSQSGASYTCIGDSTCALNSFNQPPGTAYLAGSQYSVGPQANSYMGWVGAVSNNALFIDTTLGYPGNYGGLARVIVSAGGNCTASTTLTFTPGAPQSTPANTAGAFTAATNASGALTVGQVITLGTPGSGYTSLPTPTVSGGSCTTAPTFAYVLTGTFGWGTPGDTTAGVLARLAYDTVGPCVTPADFTQVNIGTNDLVAGVAESTIVSNTAAVVSALQACNTRVVLFGITPRTVGTAGWTLALDQARLRINRARQMLAQQSRYANNGLTPVVYIDMDHLTVDPAASGAAAGNTLAGSTVDTLHQSPSTALYGALVVWNAIRGLVPPIVYQPNSQNDTYNASTNPTGNLLGTTGLMLTTSGSASGICGANTIASGWQTSTSGTGTTSTSTCAAETTRTDGLAGRRQVITYVNTGGGTAESLNFVTFTNYASSLTLGTDSIYGTAEVDISNMANVQYLGCAVAESATIGQNAQSLYAGNTAAAYGMPSSAQLSLLQEAKVLPDFGMTAAGSFRLSCKTPPIKTQAGATSYSFYITVKGSSSGVTETVTLKVGNVAVRKVAP